MSRVWARGRANPRGVPVLLATLVSLATLGAASPTGAAGAATRAAADAPVPWSAPLEFWPHDLAADRSLAVVTAGPDEVRALRMRNGSTRWRVAVSRLADLVGPALDDRTVLVPTLDRVVALERRTGATRWEQPVDDPASPTLARTPSGDRLALLAGTDGRVTAVDAATGRARWSVRYPGPVWSPVRVAAGLAVAAWSADDGRLRALSLTDGAVVWETPLLVASAAPLVHRGLVVVAEGDGEYHARVRGLDLASGAERWSTPVPASFEPVIEPGAAGDDVAVVDHFGTVTMLDASTGAPRWRRAVHSPLLRARVLVTRGAVVFRTYGRELVVLDRVTGRIRSRAVEAGVPIAVAVGGGRLLVAHRLTIPGRVDARPAPGPRPATRRARSPGDRGIAGGPPLH